MNFLSAEFLLFFPAVLAGLRLLPRRGRWALLLAASLLFYLCAAPWTVFLLGGTILLSYGCARGIEAAANNAVKRFCLALALAGCLGCLLVFKYLNFALGTAAALLGRPAPVVKLLLPVGISFYTFQTLSYVIDVYRGTCPAERHLGYYALYVSFFPQLVAGPIERPGRLLPQLHALPTPTAADWAEGGRLLLRGYCKKLLLADFAAPFVQQVYAAPGAYAGPAVAAATALFALQIYCDFSGYSDIACGAARLMGIRLMENFRQPYAAATVREFWRRWHISLTQWFTDYLYIPLGGSRCGLPRHCCNLLVVFLASGLWHGANWTFVAWGGLHGLYLVAELLLEHAAPRLNHPRTAAGLALRRGVTLALVGLAWIFFRAGSMAEAATLLRALCAGWGQLPLLPGQLGFGPAQLAWLLAALAAVQGLEAPPCPARPPLRQGLRVFFLVNACGLAWLAQLAAGTENVFIYFQF